MTDREVEVQKIYCTFHPRIVRYLQNYRAVLTLSELEELKNTEIAEVLGITLDTVKIRLHPVRSKLRRELATHCSFYRDEQNELACDLKSAFREYRKNH